MLIIFLLRLKKSKLFVFLYITLKMKQKKYQYLKTNIQLINLTFIKKQSRLVSNLINRNPKVFSLVKKFKQSTRFSLT